MSDSIHVVGSTTKKGRIKLEKIELVQPVSCDDERWADLVVDPSTHVNELAFANWVIKWQDKVRDILPPAGAGPKAKEKALQDALALASGGWKYGEKVSRAAVKLSEDEAAAFTPEQLAILARKNVRIG